ncbi:hypothetical protein [Absidia glauca]|uniref:Uncharacterized protein n=1 Tax=Absidia glauca TaxID=4829 RepID=A0A163KDH6_ABSGL|nr:hypothetical protein [Absidia glauca]
MKTGSPFATKNNSNGMIKQRLTPSATWVILYHRPPTSSMPSYPSYVKKSAVIPISYKAVISRSGGLAWLPTPCSCTPLAPVTGCHSTGQMVEQDPHDCPDFPDSFLTLPVLGYDLP